MALKHLVRPFARYLRDQAGISALEFALTAPLLIACLAGMGELSQLLVADRDVRVLEKLRQRQADRHRREEDRREVKRLDELAQQKVMREVSL